MKNFFIFFVLISAISTSIFSYELILEDSTFNPPNHYFLVKDEKIKRWECYAIPYHFEIKNINLDIYEIVENGYPLPYGFSKFLLEKNLNEDNYGFIERFY